MFLVQILGNDKTANLNIEIRYKDMVKQMSSIQKIEEIVSVLTDINQPITMDFGNILQICCRFTLNADCVKYLLKKGANPNRLDIHSSDAITYVDDNELASDKLKNELKEMLLSYAPLFPKEDKKARKQLSWDILYIGQEENEIRKMEK